MSELMWKYVKKLDDNERVRVFLKKHHVSLPEELVVCLTEFNGGRPSQKEFSTNKHEGYVFKSLLSFNAEDKENIYSFYPDLFRGTYLFPFGMDSSGNFVCYDEEHARYVLWNHETDEIEIIMI